MSEPAYVIVGGGVAGASAAEALRGSGFSEPIAILGEEEHAPYERPPLSKELLRGERESPEIALRAPEFYAKNAIQLHRNARVAELDLARRRVRCADGLEIAFGKLLIATGARPRRLHLAGDRLAGVHYLRTLDDALRLREMLRHRPRLLVVGSGFIGCEVAASARQLGCEVTLAGPSLPMQHVLGSDVAELYADRHRTRGVKLKIGANVTAFRGDRVVEAARLADGTDVECDLAVVGIGVVPAVEWLNSHVALSDGVDTDELCATNVPGVFAAGDVACSWRPRLNRRVRLEHFDNAESQGAAAGKAMLGLGRPYDPVPFFWSDQYDLSLQYYGFARDWDRVVFRGSPRDGSFVAFYVKDGRIDAAVTLNRSQDANAAKRIIGRSGMSDAELTNDTAPLRTLLLSPDGSK